MDAESLVKENRSREAKINATFNPISGEGAVGRRKLVEIPDLFPVRMYLPETMLEVKLIRKIRNEGSIGSFCLNRYGVYDKPTREKVLRAFFKVRCRHDFCFYAYAYNVIKNKEGGKNIHFLLSFPQRILLEVLEEMRLHRVPIRVILLKARQWGGSTLVQLYIAWIQLFHKEGWYSVIVAQDATTSRKIKAMYSKMLDELPPWLIGCPDDAKLAFTPYEGSQLDSIITYGKGTSSTVARDTVITVGTYNNPTSGRGGDMSCVHYSEVGLWEDTPGKKPEDIIRSISSSLLVAPLTVEVIESTANGMGNFFFREYQRAKAGKSNRVPVFIAWWQIPRYSLPVEDELAFAGWMLKYKDSDTPPPGCLDSGRYYWHLWTLGATFAAINWYTVKRKDYAEHADMAAEFPSDDVEAFKNSGNNTFNMYHLENMSSECRAPKWVGEVQAVDVKGKRALQELRFVPDDMGNLKVWKEPGGKKVANRYLVIVDIGGRSAKADFSDILVIDRYWMMYGGKPEVVAEWHGHIEHDRLAWKAAQIARWYADALLVIESNTIETKDNPENDGDTSELIFNQIADVYDNLYIRQASPEKVKKGIHWVYGFHTNRGNKPTLIQYMVACMRDATYIEREQEALDECSVYRNLGGGKYEAAEGCHDDRVMVRAIGLYICFCEMDLPKLIDESPKPPKRKTQITPASV